jgi:hypothetical protein
MPDSAAELGDYLRAQIRLVSGESLYGIVDAARDMELAFEAKCLYKQEIQTLFEGKVASALADVAPYLIMIHPNGGYLKNWARHWGNSAGILFTTSADAHDLYAHLRHIFIVEDEQNQPYFFRFYDPRVLRTFLPTCTLQQLDEFFGPVRTWICETTEENGCIVYARGAQGQLEQKLVALQSVKTVTQ